MWIDTQTREILSEHDIRGRHPNTSFPVAMPDAVFQYQRVEQRDDGLKPPLGLGPWTLQEGDPPVLVREPIGSVADRLSVVVNRASEQINLGWT